MAIAGGTCTASSETAGFDCHGAIDGVLHDAPSHTWATERVSTAESWIMCTFKQSYELVMARFMSRYYAQQAFKDIELLFDNQYVVQVRSHITEWPKVDDV